MIKLLIATALLSLMNCYTALRIFSRWPLPRMQGSWVWIFCGCCVLFQLTGIIAPRVLSPVVAPHGYGARLLSLLNGLSYLALGVLSCLMMYVLFFDLLSLGSRLCGFSSIPFCSDRRILFTLGGMTLGTVALGLRQAAAGPVIRNVDIHLPNLPAAFDGFKIVQISDLHVGPLIGRRYVENVVRMANGLQPDMIALTGDFVDGTVADLKDDVASLGQLTAPHGIFYVTGNHEYYWDVAGWLAEFGRMGIEALSNRHVMVSRGGAHLMVAGVTDLSTQRRGGDDVSDPQKAAKDSPPGVVKILLAHQPASYQKASEAGFDLQLSGHTHSGQYFPFNLLIGLFHRYYRGLNRHGNMYIYVSSGTGFWGPPLRTGVPSEITLLTLRA